MCAAALFYSWHVENWSTGPLIDCAFDWAQHFFCWMVMTLLLVGVLAVVTTFDFRTGLH